MVQPLRVFISSPGDVLDERRRAALVIQRLKREFARFFDLSAVLWEYEPMLASGHFQDIIEQPSAADVVVLILWSRLGTSLPTDRYRGLDGRVPVTGTEWEFENAVSGRAQRGTPDILVYRKTAEAVARFSHQQQLEAARIQWDALQHFWERHFEADGAFRTAFNTFDDLDGFEGMLESHLRAMLRRRLPERATSDDTQSITWHDGSPFRGLDAYETRHAAVFFGRDRAEREVTEALVRAAEAGCAFLMVTGASGSGKSSLVTAGVLANLMAPGVVAGVDTWRYVLFRPGQAPADLCGGLARAVIEQSTGLPELPMAGVSLAKLTDQFNDAPDHAGLPISVGLARAGIPENAGRLVLIVDQLEELFTLAEITDEARRTFVRLLSGLARSGLVWGLATLRSDHLHRFADAPELRDLTAGERLYHLLPPRPAEIDLLVRLPAQAAGLAFETEGNDGTGLDAIIVEAAGRHAGALPLLSFVLNELYRRDVEQGERPVLTFSSYRTMGGLEGAIASRAEEEAVKLIQPSPQVMEAALAAVLRSLVTVAEDGTATARAAARDAVAVSSERAAVLDSLIAARLVVAGSDGEANVRLAHEALLDHWPRLRDLVAEDGEFLRARGRLIADWARWEADNRSDDLLLPGGKRLADAEDLLARRHDELDPKTRAFVEASLRRDRGVRDRALRRTRGAAAALAVLTLMASALGWIAWRSGVEASSRRAEADEQREIAQIRSIEADKQRQTAEAKATEARTQLEASQVAQSQFLARESIRAKDTGSNVAALAIALAASPQDPRPDRRERPLVPEAEAALRAAILADRLRAVLVGHIETITSGAFSPDGTRFVTASEDGTARVWDVQTGSELSIFQGHRSDALSQPYRFLDLRRKITSVSFSPDGTRVATGSWDQTVRVWDAQTGGQIVVVNAGNTVVNSVSFSPDGLHILVASKDAATVWDAHTGAEIAALVVQDGDVRSASFSPDGSRVVTASTGHTARVWNAQTGAMIAVFDKHAGPITCASFSRDGRRIVTGSEDNSARVWDSRTGAEITAFTTHDGPVTAASFSPDGGLVVTASEDHSARVWDAQTGVEIAPLLGHGDGILSVSFSPDGTRVVTASKDGATALWDAQSGFMIAALSERAGRLKFALFSPDGTRIVTAYEDGTARLWDAVSGLVAAVLKGHSAGLLSASFSPDGGQVVTASEDHSARVWDAQTGAEIAPLLGHGGDIRSASFSPDGTKVATSSDDGTARIWNAQTGAQIFALQTLKAPVTTASFSPDGRRVITASLDGAATIWDAGTGAAVVSLGGLLGRVFSASFNHDGSQVITASEDGQARLWNPVTGAEFATLRASHGNRYVSASFSPDGAKVVTTGGEDAARVWDAKSGRELATLKGHGAIASAASFSPDGTRVVAVSYSNASGLWDAETGEEIAPLQGHRAHLVSASFSPDGTRVLTASRDGSARLWDARTGIPIATLAEHEMPIWSAEFSPDGSRVVTASQDGTARVWNVGEVKDPVAFGNMIATRALTSSERRELYLEAATAPDRQVGTDLCDTLAGDPYDPEHLGHGVVWAAIDSVRAVAACKKAIEVAPGEPRIRYQLARALLKSGDREASNAELRLAVDADYPSALAALASLGDKSNSRDWIAAADLDRQAFEQGVIAVASDLGWIAWSGAGQPANRDEAVNWWQEGADLGDPFSHARLAELYERGEQLPRDLKQALLHHAIAARLFGAVGDMENANLQSARRGTLARALPADQVAPLWYQVLDWQPRQRH